MGLPQWSNNYDFCLSNAGRGFSPCGGIMVPQALGCSQKFRKQQNMRLYLKYSRQEKKGGGMGKMEIGNKNGRMLTTKAGCS